jgi:hypothetical protein
MGSELFLARNQASFIAGDEIVMDGGLSQFDQLAIGGMQVVLSSLDRNPVR